MLPSLEDIAPKLAESKVFSTLDAASGFCQIPIDEDSQLLTTFITPFRRYEFCRLPFGISSDSEIFQRKMSTLLGGLDGVEVIMDDMLVHGYNREEYDARLNAVLRINQRLGPETQPKELRLQKNWTDVFWSPDWSDGIKPGPERVEALLELSRPNNVCELRTVLGMFQYLAEVRVRYVVSDEIDDWLTQVLTVFVVLTLPMSITAVFSEASPRSPRSEGVASERLRTPNRAPSWSSGYSTSLTRAGSRDCTGSTTTGRWCTSPGCTHPDKRSTLTRTRRSLDCGPYT